MRYCDFFDRVEPVRLYDPLARFLGAVEDGVMEFGYLDCVKLAGHSCPTVAGAYILAHRGLRALYDGELPRRGGIEVELREEKSEGVTGVVGTVVAYLCGAGDEGGFAGIGGRFTRRGLLHYGRNLSGDLRLSRLDDSRSVTLRLDTSIVPPDPRMMSDMKRLLSGEEDEKIASEFARLWQERVQTMLTQPQLWERIAVVVEQSH